MARNRGRRTPRPRRGKSPRPPRMSREAWVEWTPARDDGGSDRGSVGVGGRHLAAAHRREGLVDADGDRVLDRAHGAVAEQKVGRAWVDRPEVGELLPGGRRGRPGEGV